MKENILNILNMLNIKEENIKDYSIVFHFKSGTNYPLEKWNIGWSIYSYNKCNASKCKYQINFFVDDDCSRQHGKTDEFIFAGIFEISQESFNYKEGSKELSTNSKLVITNNLYYNGRLKIKLSDKYGNIFGQANSLLLSTFLDKCLIDSYTAEYKIFNIQDYLNN